MCPLCEPCMEQAALCCSLFICVYNTEISVFWVLGIYTTLHLQSLFSSYHSKGGNGLSCIYEHFCLFWKLFLYSPVVFPTIWRFFFLFVCFLCWDSQFPKILFLPVERKLMLHMKGVGKSCQSKLVQKVLAVMLPSKHTAESLWGTSVLQVAEFITNRSSS